jgi:transposase InsO family protein
MKIFVARYVQGCAECQANKIRTHPPIVSLVPNKVPLQPFQVMSTDFITDLPECEGFNAVSIWVNRGHKTVYIVSTRKKVTSAETSNLFIRYIFPHTGVMEQLIFDRGPQFASQISQHIFKTLGIKSTMSTAYHPQTDSQTERFNQELEQYIRAFCDYRQDNWVKWLPLAQFAHNSQITTSTGRSPFDLLYGFTPRSLPRIASDAPWPNVEARLKALDDARDKARASLSLAAD